MPLGSLAVGGFSCPAWAGGQKRRVWALLTALASGPPLWLQTPAGLSTARDWLAVVAGPDGRIYPTRARCLDIRVTPTQLPRALRIVDALTKAIGARDDRVGSVLFALH